MITITEEPYDSSAGLLLVQALLDDLNDRYADIDDPDDEEVADDAYLAEVTPSLAARPQGTFLVAWIEGEPAGCGALKPLDGDPTVGEIKRMYTAPTARRRGVSRAILGRLESVAAELGYRCLQLETGTAQPEAMRLYESTGWQRIAPYGLYQHSSESVCFAKDLEGP